MQTPKSGLTNNQSPFNKNAEKFFDGLFYSLQIFARVLTAYDLTVAQLEAQRDAQNSTPSNDIFNVAAKNLTIASRADIGPGGQFLYDLTDIYGIFIGSYLNFINKYKAETSMEVKPKYKKNRIFAALAGLLIIGVNCFLYENWLMNSNSTVLQKPMLLGIIRSIYNVTQVFGMILIIVLAGKIISDLIKEERSKVNPALSNENDIIKDREKRLNSLKIKFALTAILFISVSFGLDFLVFKLFYKFDPEKGVMMVTTFGKSSFGMVAISTLSALIMGIGLFTVSAKLIKSSIGNFGEYFQWYARARDVENAAFKKRQLVPMTVGLFGVSMTIIATAFAIDSFAGPKLMQTFGPALGMSVKNLLFGLFFFLGVTLANEASENVCKMITKSVKDFAAKAKGQNHTQADRIGNYSLGLAFTVGGFAVAAAPIVYFGFLEQGMKPMGTALPGTHGFGIAERGVAVLLSVTLAFVLLTIGHMFYARSKLQGQELRSAVPVENIREQAV